MPHMFHIGLDLCVVVAPAGFETLHEQYWGAAAAAPAEAAASFDGVIDMQWGVGVRGRGEGRAMSVQYVSDDDKASCFMM